MLRQRQFYQDRMIYVESERSIKALRLLRQASSPPRINIFQFAKQKLVNNFSAVVANYHQLFLWALHQSDETFSHLLSLLKIKKSENDDL